MGRDHQERRKRLAQVGEYRPEVYRVTVQEPESERARRRRYALQRFKDWAGPELAPRSDR